MSSSSVGAAGGAQDAELMRQLGKKGSAGATPLLLLTKNRASARGLGLWVGLFGPSASTQLCDLFDALEKPIIDFLPGCQGAESRVGICFLFADVC